MIPVTKSFLPPIEEYIKYLEGIWERGHLTNHGPLVLELEEKLRNLLGVKHFFFVTNGTIALQVAIRAAGMEGEVITTPFSYVATTSSLVWEHCKPVFADIDPETFTISPDSIKAVITPATRGILATHVYGNPCQVDAIEAIAKEHNLKVIYDAAHAFGVEFKGQSVLNYGDISTLSFHATKLFHTIEGGAIITADDELAHRISYMRNFGHNGPEAFYGMGINGKASEFQAAMGLCLLPHLDEIIIARKEICARYDQQLSGLSKVKRLRITEGTSLYNYAYYPVVFQDEQTLLKVKEALDSSGIFGRRYFYPSLNTLNYVKNNLVNDNAGEISKRVFCLPLFPELDERIVDQISELISDMLC
jgi:dTDP-4-amino-4,6-dideoxygalactose transaminase